MRIVEHTSHDNGGILRIERSKQGGGRTEKRRRGARSIAKYRTYEGAIQKLINFCAY